VLGTRHKRRQDKKKITTQQTLSSTEPPKKKTEMYRGAQERQPIPTFFKDTRHFTKVNSDKRLNKEHKEIFVKGKISIAI
jgi:hypothetical protein